MKSACNFCWAKLYGGGCHIVDERDRNIHCQKAMERMKSQVSNKGNYQKVIGKSKQPVSNQETRRLRNFITYLSKRIRYLKLFQGNVELSEYKYYCELRNQIKNWGKSRVVPYAFLCGKISLNKAIVFYGVSKREFYRLMQTQRRRLIKFIEEQEEVLKQKYPFIPMSDIFCEE